MAPLHERNPPTIGENINPMEMPFGSVGEKNNQLVPYGESLTIDTRAGIASMYGSSEQTESPSIDVRKLVARYWLLLVSLVTLGAAGGFVSVVLSSPMYRASLLLEVQGINLALKDGVFGG